jgi:hypothetical protein
LVIAAWLVISITNNVDANELWSCYVAKPSSKEPMLFSIEAKGREMIQTWASGTTARYSIAQNNRYGLVGFSSISEIEAGEVEPTVGASTVVINRSNKEIWLSTAIAGRQRIVNALDHGSCIFSH